MMPSVAPTEVCCFEMLFDVFDTKEQFENDDFQWCACPIIAFDDYDQTTMRYYNLLTEEEAWQEVANCPDGTYLKVVVAKHGDLEWDSGGECWRLDGTTGVSGSYYHCVNREWVEIPAPCQVGRCHKQP